MLFHSIDFAIFLPLVFLIYWALNNHLHGQNAFILLASVVFYGWWDARFLLLIAVSSLLDYWAALGIAKSTEPRQRRAWLALSMVGNLGMLGFFKYFNFFIDSFVTAFSWLGYELSAPNWAIILPAGISFYTFQTMSYTIDVYRRELTPTRDWVAFGAFVGFFPQLVAGPIERASNLLPQFYTQRRFDYANATDGLRQMLWGFAKKTLIADNCAEYANIIFNNSADYGGATIWLGTIFFAFQIYGDFSGYSDIAIGCSRLFGFNLQRNFAYPFFSRDIAEFWRRWHISLSSWFKDYLYLPLGGSRGGKWMALRNTSLIFLVSGFWHGANWTYIVWGGLHALYMLPLVLLSLQRKNVDTVAAGRYFPSLYEIIQMATTFILLLISWILFRADSLSQAADMYSRMFSASVFQMPFIIEPATGLPILPKKLLLFVCFFMLIEWLARSQLHPLAVLKQWPTWARWLSYWLLVQLVLLFSGTSSPFIYFQF